MTDPLAEAAQALSEATDSYNRTDQRYREASSDRTNAANRLNEAQKKFDAVIADMKKSAPRDSDWNRPKGYPA